jgi:protein SCO1/2
LLGDTNAPPKDYFARGVVKDVVFAEGALKIQHEEIPGYMKAMTMVLTVRPTNVLTDLRAGDVVTFHLMDSGEDGWAERVVKIGVQAAAAPEPVRVSRDVEPLREGDLLPDYRFTNELGEAVHLVQYRGRALALAFFYTRCPFPTFCPRTSRQLAETIRQLKATPAGPTNWQVLSLSFDPGFDTVAVLYSYARQWQADPRCWNFLTGTIEDIDAITDQFGMVITRSETGFDHNLRVVVVSSQGRIRKILAGNQWQAGELARELTAAARE